MINPPSRNYLAYLLNPTLPSSSNPLSSLPEIEPNPQSLTGGRTCGRVGRVVIDGRDVDDKLSQTQKNHDHYSSTTTQTKRDYDQPKSRSGSLLPLDIRAIYAAGSEINVSVLLSKDDMNMGGGGHFEFHACPVEYPNTPSDECFNKHPLEFVHDVSYGAQKDINHPERAYVPYSSAFSSDNILLDEVITNIHGEEGGSTMVEYSYILRLPRDEDGVDCIVFGKCLETSPDILVKRGVPNGEVVDGVMVYTERDEQQQQSLAYEFVYGAAVDMDDDDERRHKIRNRRREQAKNEDMDDYYEKLNAGMLNAEEDVDDQDADGNVLANEEEEEEEEEKEKTVWTQNGGLTTDNNSDTQTVLISSVVTDGKGTTTIHTLHGGTQIIPGGPHIPASSTSTYGSKEIYGLGINNEPDIFWAVPDDPNIATVTPIIQMSEETLKVEETTTPVTTSPKATTSTTKATATIPTTAETTTVAATIAVSTTTASDIPHIPVAATPANTRYVLLRLHYVPARTDCYPIGYDTYQWPIDAWGEWTRPLGGVCDDDNNDNIDDDSDGTSNSSHDEYWNCAEILILGDGRSSGGSAIESSATEPATQSPPEPILAPMLAKVDALSAKDDFAETTGTYPVLIDVIKNDIGEGSLIIKGTRHGRHGLCEVTTDNRVKYTPTLGLKQDRCSYVVCLGNGGNLCDTAWVYVNVKSDNRENILTMSSTKPKPSKVVTPSSDDVQVNAVVDELSTNRENILTIASMKPKQDMRIIAVEDGVSTGLNKPITIDVVANDEYTGSLIPFIKRLTLAHHGTCEVVNDKVLYMPDDGYVGWDRCAYRVCLPSRRMVCDEALIKIKVIGSILPADSPMPKQENANVVATNDESSTMGDKSIFIDVTANDSAPDGKKLVLTKVNRAIHGKCEIINNNVRYTPPSIDIGFVGWDQCAYIVCSLATNRLGKSFDRDIECDRGRIDVLVESISTGDDSIEWDDDIKNDDDDDDNNVNEKIQDETDEKMNTKVEEFPNDVRVRPDRPTDIIAELAENEPESSVASVYAADEKITTLQNTPIKVDVVSNDFSKGVDILLNVTQTGGAEHGNCVVTSDNHVKYIPDPEFVGVDHCGYITCRSFVCDEGILAIKVTSLRAEQSPSSDFVSNYESSGGLSLIEEEYKGERNLRVQTIGRLAYNLKA